MYLSVRHSLFSCILISAASFALSNGISMADSTQTETFKIGGNIQDAASSGQFTLPDFNSSLGTLESVDLTLCINSTSSIEVYNTASTPVGFTNASLTLPLSVSAPDDINFSLDLGASLASGTANPGLNTYGGLTTKEVLGQSVGESSLALFENQQGGVVTFGYTKGNPTYTGTDLGSSLFFGGSETGSGELKVVYTYLNSSVQPTPEPASMYLSLIVALAMAGLLAGRAKGLLRA